MLCARGHGRCARCLIEPDVAPPQAPLADAWIESHDAQVDSSCQEYRDWWRAFGDPQLEQLIDTAYQQNLALRIAGVRVLKARAQLGLVIGELYPQSSRSPPR
jgi:outer membrane protein TolC